jgi:hypothetical protein
MPAEPRPANWETNVTRKHGGFQPTDQNEEEIMTKKFWISVVAMFVMCMAIGFLVHGTLLAPEYAKLTNLFRPEADQAKYFPFMLLAHVFIAVGFTWIYLRGREDKPFVGQGLRYGAAVAVLSTIPTYLIYLAVQPMPEALVVKQIVFDTIGFMAMGVVIAWINK